MPAKTVTLPRPELSSEESSEEISAEQRAEITKLLRMVADRFEDPEGEEARVYALVLVAATTEGVIGASLAERGTPGSVMAPFHVAALHLIAALINENPEADGTPTNPVVGRVVAGGDA